MKLLLDTHIFLWFISGKLPLPQSPEIYIPRQRLNHQIKSLAINESSLKYLITLPNLHRDPFDRILVSQALGNNLKMVTVDPEILNYNVSFLK